MPQLTCCPGLSQKTQAIINASISAGTNSQYKTTFNRWIAYCSSKNIDPFKATIAEGLEFLTHLFEKFNLYYSAMNSARSALSMIFPKSDGVTFGNAPIVSRYMKGVFKLRPSLPKYTTVYDADQVLQYLDLIQNESASLERLGKKTLMLMLFMTSQRNQTMESIDLRTIHECKPLKIIDIFIPEILKTTNPGRHLEPIRLNSYPRNINLCPVRTLNKYIEITKDIRSENDNLFISYKAPHRQVVSTTLSKWAKSILSEAGIDISCFTAHSTRAASSSKKLAMNVSLADIRKAAGWTESSTFAKYYKKPIVASSL